MLTLETHTLVRDYGNYPCSCIILVKPDADISPEIAKLGPIATDTLFKRLETDGWTSFLEEEIDENILQQDGTYRATGNKLYVAMLYRSKGSIRRMARTMDIAKRACLTGIEKCWPGALNLEDQSK